LLDHFGKLTGFPIVLNTSMNNNVEPIVDNVDDSVVCYLTTGLNYLVIGDYVVERRALTPSDVSYDTLYPDLPIYRFLAIRQQRGGGRAYCLGSNAHPWLSPAERHISEPLFRVLERADGRLRLGDLMDEQRIETGARVDMRRELLTLWHDRCVVLSPRPRREEPGARPA
jgi:carbamoyltransferase